jgi:hypothetical protein
MKFIEELESSLAGIGYGIRSGLQFVSTIHIVGIPKRKHS